ncbi:MAG: hypothetical protein Q7R41_11755, partial [Phycisphaerales bacterium]|nr:hypothetical protein [Phycisphaerales bacterium]
MSKTTTEPVDVTATFDYPARRLGKELAAMLFGVAEASAIDAGESEHTIDADSARQIMDAIHAVPAGKSDGAPIRIPLTDDGDALLWLWMRGLVNDLNAAVTAARTFDPSNATGFNDEGDVWRRTHNVHEAVRLFDNYRRARACRAKIASEGPDATLTVDNPGAVRYFREFMDWTDGGEAVDGISHILSADVLTQLDAGDTITAPRAWLLRQLQEMIEQVSE